MDPIEISYLLLLNRQKNNKNNPRWSQQDHNILEAARMERYELLDALDRKQNLIWTN